MEPLTNFSIEFTRWLQTNYPQLQSVFVYASSIGRPEFYLIIVSLIYWCLNKNVGKAIGYLLSLGALLNSVIKHAFRDPRPYWIDSSIGLASEDSYGIPSGHTQWAATFYIFLAAVFRRGWLWLLAAPMIFLIALSRVYLGVHDIPDVLAGLLLASLILAGYFLWRKYAATIFDKRILGQRLLVAVTVPLILAGAYVIIILLMGEADTSVEWASFIDAAKRASLEYSANSFGFLVGLSIGFVLETSRVRFLIGGPIWQRALRFIVGIVVELGIYLGFERLLPPDPLLLVIPLRILQSLLVALWISYYGPQIFVRLGLAKARPQPEISLTI